MTPGVGRQCEYIAGKSFVMKAIVVTDQAAGTAGMTLVERPEPKAGINDVVSMRPASFQPS